jgi:hypothetical protein
MKIKITTIREIADIDYDDWIQSLQRNGISINAKKLKEEGSYTYADDLGFTKATTTYEICTETKFFKDKDKSPKTIDIPTVIAIIILSLGVLAYLFDYLFPAIPK